MDTKISKWGNSIRIRIPKSTIDQLNLNEGHELELSTTEGLITIKPIAPKYTIQQLYQGMTTDGVLDQLEEIPKLGKEQYWSHYE